MKKIVKEEKKNITLRTDYMGGVTNCSVAVFSLSVSKNQTIVKLDICIYLFNSYLCKLVSVEVRPQCAGKPKQ